MYRGSDGGFLIELPTPTSLLIREMASGMVRIALECEAAEVTAELLEAPRRAYCNGKKCEYANNRRECGGEEGLWVLKAVDAVSVGGSVAGGGGGG